MSQNQTRTAAMEADCEKAESMCEQIIEYADTHPDHNINTEYAEDVLLQVCERSFVTEKQLLALENTIEAFEIA